MWEIQACITAYVALPPLRITGHLLYEGTVVRTGRVPLRPGSFSSTLFKQKHSSSSRLQISPVIRHAYVGEWWSTIGVGEDDVLVRRCPDQRGGGGGGEVDIWRHLRLHSNLPPPPPPPMHACNCHFLADASFLPRWREGASQA